jgi:hypothetical protein
MRSRQPLPFGGASLLALLLLAGGAGAQSTSPAVGALPVSAPAPVAPTAPAPAATSAPKPQRIELHADLQNLFLLRNDSDFDRTRPFYDESGQTVGAFATLFRPSALLRITDHLRIYYEVELGLNYWSKQNPDEQSALAPSIFVMKHREIYAEGELWRERFGFKVGYQYFGDPTALFLGHWIGAAQAHIRLGSGRLGLFVGEIPDDTYEGVNVLENNFVRDIFVFGLNGALRVTERLRGSAALVALVDTHVVGKMRWLLCPTLHLETERGRFSAFLDLALQAGQLRGQAVDGSDQTHVAWALQAGARYELSRPRLDMTWNLLALSPDDAHEGNTTNHAFLYSSKSRSATLMLTEDELRNWYDALDRRMGTYEGGFYMHRAGLLVTDVKAAWTLHRFFQAALVVGAAAALKPTNALDSGFIGVETDALLTFPANEHLSATIAGGLLVPGKAGAALINRIRLDATDPIVMVEASLVVRY